MYRLSFYITLTIAALVGYYAQKHGRPPKPRIIGIDLGTTYSCVGSYQAGSGDVYVIRDEEGNSCIPSVVSFSPTKGVLVGFEALGQVNSANTIYDSKRIIGRTFTRQELDREVKNYPFKIYLNESGSPYYLVDNPDPLVVTPVDVARLILERLMNIAHMKLQRNITEIVMSFPADFNKDQKEASLKAAEMAGMKVSGVLTEPTAASMAYGAHRNSSISNLAVIDFGGGTFDVSLLFLADGVFTTIGMAGDNHLGGQDVNNLIFEYFAGKFNLTDLTGEEIEGINAQIESAKILLSTQESVYVNLSTNSAVFAEFFHRSTFEDIIRPLFLRILKPISVLLEESSIPVEDVDEVVLVGGSTRIPAVRKLLSEYFRFVPNSSVDPEIAVVLGVAMHSGIIGGMWPVTVSVVEHLRNISKINV